MDLKDLTGRLARWSLQLQAFNFNIEHRKGTENLVADVLSRAPSLDDNEITQGKMINLEPTEFESEEYRELIKNIAENKNMLPDLKIDK